MHTLLVQCCSTSLRCRRCRYAYHIFCFQCLPTQMPSDMINSITVYANYSYPYLRCTISITMNGVHNMQDAYGQGIPRMALLPRERLATWQNLLNSIDGGKITPLHSKISRIFQRLTVEQRLCTSDTIVLYSVCTSAGHSGCGAAVCFPSTLPSYPGRVQQRIPRNQRPQKRCLRVFSVKEKGKNVGSSSDQCENVSRPCDRSHQHAGCEGGGKLAPCPSPL